MKKTVFVGKVNDQEFDNVNEYNACVQAMLDMGEDFQASSSTQVVEVPDEDVECDCDRQCGDGCCCCQRKELEPSATYLPGASKFPDGSYIDEFTIISDNAYYSKLTKLQDSLMREYDNIVEAIPHNSKDQLDVYLNAVNEIIGVLDGDRNKTADALMRVYDEVQKLEEKLEKLYENQATLERADDVIDEYYNFYTAVNHEVTGELSKYEQPKEKSRNDGWRSIFDKLLMESFNK